MNIVICTSQVPFVRGGAEELADGLTAALLAQGHNVEQIALPFKWYPRAQIEKTALLWRTLDLSALARRKIDLVVCTKFPTWAVRHPRKVVWLVHQHRQAYDWYGTPLTDFGLSQSDQHTRRLIMETDRLGIGEAAKVFTISQNVANRLARYNGLKGVPLYPPLKHELWHNADYGDYIFYLGRLDSAKRIDLLLKALQQTKTPVRVVIGGSGPDLERLQTLTHSLKLTARVEFLGRIAETEAVKLYAGALAVFYAPVDEDYGYVTLEAMRSSKPVLTGPDSGGVLEFVRDDYNGFICFDPPAYAAAIDHLYQDRALAARLGVAGCNTSQIVPTWDEVVKQITG